MKLKMFDFIENVSGEMLDRNYELENVKNEIEIYFKEILVNSEQDYLNVNSRIKSIDSLKEKILRNNYYKHYESCQTLINNISDLIGIRIECRFIQDETSIYMYLKKHFNNVHKDGYYYNENNECIRLDLAGKQPQEQKNGFEIFRIDGIYEENGLDIRFELQIKSIVNVFWGEVEHKIIYKNNNYTLVDDFFKDMMASIKKNLSMIDNQLLIMFNQLNKGNIVKSEVRKSQFEGLLSKSIHEIFSTKMKNKLGFVIDFRKSCDIIMKYILRSNNADNLRDYSTTIIKTLGRLNEITQNEIDFNKEIEFEREIEFEDEFSSILGKFLLGSINKDFHWNLFFKMLFEIELGNNSEDFETFIRFLKKRFSKNENFKKLYLMFEEDEAYNIQENILIQISISLSSVDNISCIYDCNIEKINKSIRTIVKSICANINSYDEWINLKEIYLELFNLKILSIFNCKIDRENIKEYIKKINDNCTEKDMTMEILGYITKLDVVSQKSIEEVLDLFKI